MAKKQDRSTKIPQSPETQIRTGGRKLEIGTCYISSDWEEIREATILVSRRHKQGATSFGVFEVDLAMKGLTDTFYAYKISEKECTHFFDDYLANDEHVEIDYIQAHNIIYGAIEYGIENGYNAHKDFSISQFMLEEDNDEVPLVEIEFGVNGKPTLFEDDEEEEDEDALEFDKEPADYWHEIVTSLADIKEEDITTEYKNAEEFQELIQKWGADDWKSFFEKNSKNIPLQFLDYAVTFAWDHFNDVLDYDHFENQFTRELKREETRLPELDEMNERANELIEAEKFDLVPLIYDNVFTFKDLFPYTKVLPSISAIEMCRIFCEYFTEEEDFFEAISYYALIQILEWNEYSEEVLKTGKKLMLSAIKNLPIETKE